jgi:transketolase
MAAILNGIALRSLTRAYGGTFLVFSDYMRPAVRLAALMKLAAIHVWTHDSIGLSEDGPTHQPVEQLAALRAIPGLDVVRPAGLVLTRQNLPVLDRDDRHHAPADQASRGGYTLSSDRDTTPDALLIATGSEVHIALAAQKLPAVDGVSAHAVSMPCREWFAAQPQSYRDQVLPPEVRARVSVEAAVGQGWRDIVGDAGRIVSLEHFGASADYQRLYTEFGITPEALAASFTTASATRPARLDPAAHSRLRPRPTAAPATGPDAGADPRTLKGRSGSAGNLSVRRFSRIGTVERDQFGGAVDETVGQAHDGGLSGFHGLGPYSVLPNASGPMTCPAVRTTNRSPRP